MSFNIGNQSGGVINNVAGDQHVIGGQQGVQVSQQEAVSAAAALSEALAAADLGGLSEAERAEVREEAAAIHEDMAAPKPSRESVGSRLEHLTSVLSTAGALAGAGSALLGPLSTLARWLGPLGASALRMLPFG
jgi:hypothetical protein